MKTRKGNVAVVLVSIIGAVALTVGLVAFGIVMWGVSVIKDENVRRNAIVSKSNAVEIGVDTMWKVIKQKAQITDAAAANIKDMNKVYAELIDGRAGGTLFKMVQENYPNLSASEMIGMYTSLMQTVESQRNTLKREQDTLQDMLAEHRNSQTNPGHNFVLSMFGSPESTKEFKRKGVPTTPADWPNQYVLVTSAATKVMAETGEENDVEVFAKPTATGK